MNDSFDKTISGGKFDEVFTEVSHAETLGLKNPEQLRLFHLNVNNNAFSSDKLEVFLRKNIGQYVFSRAQIENYHVEGDVYSVGMDAIDIMKRNGAPGQKGTGNDLGEIMLYVFLEQVLGAPKIMSKVELQTGAKQCFAAHLHTDRYSSAYLRFCRDTEKTVWTRNIFKLLLKILSSLSIT